MKQIKNIVALIFSLSMLLTYQPFVFAEEHEHEHGSDSHAEQGGHDAHEGHEEEALKFSNTELQEFNIKLAQAQPGFINKSLDLTGEIIVAPERLYHVVPRVAGVVRKVYRHLGDSVQVGELLAVLSSRDLADAKAQFVAADSLLKLANSNLQRETKLYKEKITAKRNYFVAKQAQAEMSIKRKAAQQRLLALGLSQQAVRSVLHSTDKDLTLYELRAPATGVIIEKHAVQGEVLSTNTRSFTVADLSQVWVNLTVYQKDLARIKQGQTVLISSHFEANGQERITQGVISWMSPTLNQQTRSATARVVLDNPNGDWRPGSFVSAKVAIAKIAAHIVVPLSALQSIAGQTVVFVQHEDGDFEPQVVQVGHRDMQHIEITQGLHVGQTYVSQNAFSLKAQMQKSEFGEGHSH